MKFAPLALLLAPLCAFAQIDPPIPLDWEKLSAKATERVEVTLDGNLLQSVAGFLNNGDKDSAEVKQLLAGLKGIYVHSYQFDSDNAYPRQDLEAARTRLKSANWGRIVQSVNREDGENTEVYLKNLKSNSDIPGLVVLCAERRELTVVQIAGKIDPNQIGKLSGTLGIPDLAGKQPSKARHSNDE